MSVVRYFVNRAPDIWLQHFKAKMLKMHNFGWGSADYPDLLAGFKKAYF